MMKKKGMEMTITTVIVLVLALILLGVGIYIIYTKILEPTEGATSVLDCDARNGNPVANCGSCPSSVCLKLPTGDESRPFCCIERLTGQQ